MLNVNNKKSQVQSKAVTHQISHSLSIYLRKKSFNNFQINYC